MPATPHTTDSTFVPFASRLGKVLIAYGRAHRTICELAQLMLGNEIEAMRFVDRARGKELPRKMRKLCRQAGIDDESIQIASAQIQRFREAAHDRNVLVHGELWFDTILGDGELMVRHLSDGRVDSDPVGPEHLDSLVEAFESVADELECLCRDLENKPIQIVQVKLPKVIFDWNIFTTARSYRINCIGNNVQLTALLR